MLYRAIVTSTYYFQIPEHIKEKDIEYFETENDETLHIFLKSGEEVIVTKCRKFVGSLGDTTDGDIYDYPDHEKQLFGN